MDQRTLAGWNSNCYIRTSGGGLTGWVGDKYLELFRLSYCCQKDIFSKAGEIITRRRVCRTIAALARSGLLLQTE